MAQARTPLRLHLLTPKILACSCRDFCRPRFNVVKAVVTHLAPPTLPRPGISLAAVFTVWCIRAIGRCHTYPSRVYFLGPKGSLKLLNKWDVSVLTPWLDTMKYTIEIVRHDEDGTRKILHRTPTHIQLGPGPAWPPPL